MNVPTKQKPPTHGPQVKSSMPFMMQVIVDAPAENIIMYMLEAEATFGGTPGVCFGASFGAALGLHQAAF